MIASLNSFFEAMRQKPLLNLFILTTLLMLIVDVFNGLYFYERIYLIIFRNFTVILVLNILIFHILFLIFGVKFKFVAYVYFVLIFLLCLVDIFLLKNFYTTINSVIIDALINTTKSEIYEFIQVYFDFKFCLLLVFLVIISYTILNFNVGGGRKR
ncbi:hypothetical protein KDE12_05835 [Campylobacter sp. faydin G-105]|uniref:hypothetical protein n=1 Tax=Campylobacter anatolicus TaxID=2829105 RepID=UPI001B93539E|nr:hypothetical protein [Campylobacter anatolicus]MBR8462374.1 hypothetical protein [Campylobacter anatolicus]